MMRALVALACSAGFAFAQAPPSAPPNVGPNALAMPNLGGPAPSLYEKIIGIVLERHMKAPVVTPRRKALIRITMDETGAVIGHALERASGDAGFDATLINTVRKFQVTGVDRLPVPQDPKLRKAALGAGLVVPVYSPKPKPQGRKTVPHIAVPEAIKNPPPKKTLEAPK